MRERSLIIICITAIILVGIVSATLLLYQNMNNNTTNTTNNTTNNTTLNQTDNTTNNTTGNNTTTKQSTSKSSTKKSTSKKSGSSSDTINGEKINERHNFAGDPNIEYIGTKNNIYLKDKKSGRTVKRHLDSDGVYRFY